MARDIHEAGVHILTCTMQADEHKNYQRLLKSPDGEEVLFGWVLPTAVKCAESDARGVYFVTTVEELKGVGHPNLGDYHPQIGVICFEAAQEGEGYQQITARLQYALSRPVHGIPVRPKASSG